MVDRGTRYKTDPPSHPLPTILTDTSPPKRNRPAVRRWTEARKTHLYHRRLQRDDRNHETVPLLQFIIYIYMLQRGGFRIYIRRYTCIICDGRLKKKTRGRKSTTPSTHCTIHTHRIIIYTCTRFRAFDLLPTSFYIFDRRAQLILYIIWYVYIYYTWYADEPTRHTTTTHPGRRAIYIYIV